MTYRLTLLFLLLSNLQAFAQNIHFVSPCTDTIFSTGPGSCAAMVDLTVMAVSDDSCSLGNTAIDYLYTISINEADTSYQVMGVSNLLQHNLPKGSHDIEYIASDHCTNERIICNFTIEVEDLESPTLVCHVGVSTIPISGQYRDVNAKDFVYISNDNCTSEDRILYSYSSDPMDSVIRIENTCENLTGLPVPITIYLWDESGNYSTCEVAYLIGSQLHCQPPDCSIIGIHTEDNDWVGDVSFEGGCIGPLSGYYGGCMQIPMPEDSCTIKPIKDINPLNGVSTFDLLLISRHILGIRMLDSPYKIIAADVNNSNSVTTFDLVELRKLILYVTTTFSNNTSWRFIDQNFNFPDASNPFLTSFPEAVVIHRDSTERHTDFIAVKIGDVNGSVNPAEIVPSTSEDRSHRETLPVSIADQELTAGESYTIDFSAKHFESIAGFQFVLQVDTDALRFEQLHINNVLDYFSENNFGMEQLDQGILPVSWNSFEGADLKDGTPLFSLRFTALQDGTLSDWLGIQKNLLAAEAYEENGTSIDLMNVTLQFEEVVDLSSGFQVAAAQPNPFAEQTSIAIQLPQASALVLRVFDIHGRLVYSTRYFLEKGKTQLNVSADNLPGAGLYYYQMHTDSGAVSGNILLH